jgi:hypothetical protein
VSYFTPDQISLDHHEPDGDAIYRVELPGAGFPGWVRLRPSQQRRPDVEAWIVEQLDALLLRFGVQILHAALAKPLPLD